MRKKVLGFAMIFLVLCLAPGYATEALVLDEAYWEDRTASATFSEATQAHFESYDGTIARGYTQSAIWLRLRIAGQSGSEPLAILVRPAFLKHIELYDPASTGLINPLVSGRDARIEDNNHIGFENGFIISSRPADRDIYLRVTSNTTLTADVTVLRVKDAYRLSRIIDGTISFYFAFLLLFCLWACVNWLIRRDIIYGLFAARQIYSALHIFVFFGLMRFFFSYELSASIRDIIYCFITVTIVVAGLFDARLLFEFGASRKLMWIYLTLISGSLLCIALIIMGHTHSALYFNSFIVNASMLLLLLLALSTRNQANQPYGALAIWIIRAGFLLMTVAVAVPVLMYQNIIRSSVPILNVLFAHALISSTILFSILSIRARQRDLLIQQSIFQFEMSSRELQQEQTRRLENERFLSMLTHELRNPLTVIRLLTDGNSSSGMAVQKAAIDMARVIERVEQSEKLKQGEAEIQHSSFRLNNLLRDLAASNDVQERLDLDVPPDLTLYSDEMLITRVLTNLVDNAAKYGSSTSRISIWASNEVQNNTGGVAISVSNEIGEAGRPDEESLFSKYYRGQGAHRQPGSGLGLYLVKGWIEMLGGAITYDGSTEASGADLIVFKIWIPQ